jgi:hypothetical protein
MESDFEAAGLIHRSLEHIAEQAPDLTPLVYRRYFSRHPEARELFGNDSGDCLKGEMLTKIILQIMEYTEGRSDPDLIASWAGRSSGLRGESRNVSSDVRQPRGKLARSSRNGVDR